MASLNYSVFTAFTILAISLALCSASRTTLFSKDVGEIERDDHQVSLDHTVPPPPRKMDHKVPVFIAKDDNYEPEEKPPKRGDDDAEAAKMSNMDDGDMMMGDVQRKLRPGSSNDGDMAHMNMIMGHDAAKMSNVDHSVSGFDTYDPEEKQKPGKYDVELAQMHNMDQGGNDGDANPEKGN